MADNSPLRLALKRGALITAANWPVVVIQLVGESAFKVLLSLLVLGAAAVMVLILGSDLGDLLGSDLRDSLAAVTDALVARPLALSVFLAAFVMVVLAGSVAMFLLKGGIMTVLVEADRLGGPVERPPLRATRVRQAGRFSIDLFRRGCGRLFRRYLRLGLGLLAVYGLSGTMYVIVVLRGYAALWTPDSSLTGLTFLAGVSSGALVLWITVVNILYGVTQVVIAADDVGVAVAMRRVGRFLRTSLVDVAGVAAVILVLVIAATAISIVAVAALGLIAFVPLAGFVTLPLQAIAWFVRGIVFQFLGLTGLCAYLKLYREPVPESGRHLTATKAAS